MAENNNGKTFSFCFFALFVNRPAHGKLCIKINLPYNELILLRSGWEKNNKIYVYLGFYSAEIGDRNGKILPNSR